MTRANVLFYGYNLVGDAPEYLVGGDGSMFLGAAFNSLPLLPLDPAVPCSIAYAPEGAPEVPGCGVRTFGDPEDPGLDDLAFKFSNIWGSSGYATTSENFLPGIRVRFDQYDPATCDVVGGFETGWTAICETYEMPAEMPTLTGSSYMSPETALVPADAELIYSEEIVFPPEVLPFGETTEAFYFYRDIEGRGRINKDNFDDIDPTHGLPDFG
ncbi:MAG: hypothetical protein Q8M31_21180 [Beijerinckiaceae bacterium]|nr:hypothetical protein [Beijerinckiaceae bacterium]